MRSAFMISEYLRFSAHFRLSIIAATYVLDMRGILVVQTDLLFSVDDWKGILGGLANVEFCSPGCQNSDESAQTRLGKNHVLFRNISSVFGYHTLLTTGDHKKASHFDSDDSPKTNTMSPSRITTRASSCACNACGNVAPLSWRDANSSHSKFLIIFVG